MPEKKSIFARLLAELKRESFNYALSRNHTAGKTMIQQFSSPKSEKERIERATAEKFLHLYNKRHGAHFKITTQGDHPDIACRDVLTGQLLYIEITLLEDWDDDIQAVLGRAERKTYSPTTGIPAISFEEDTLPKLRARLQDKLLSSYGPNTGLVIRQVSILWSSEDWMNHAGEIVRDVFAGREENYGAGVWILCREPNSWPYEDDIFELSSLARDPPFQPQPSAAERVVGKAMWERCLTKRLSQN